MEQKHMARDFPAKSAYFGSDLPEEELMIPAGEAGGDSPVDASAPLSNDLPPPYSQVLGRAAREAGIDPTLLDQGPGENPSEWLEMVAPLRSTVATDEEIAAFESMLEEHGLMDLNEEETMYGSRQREELPPEKESVGKPGMLQEDIKFSPDPSGRGRM